MKKIVKIVAISALFALCAGSALAATVFTEDFSYPLGTALNGAGGWAAHSGAGSNPQTVNSAGLVYAGYPGSGVGQALGTLATSGEDNNHTFTAITGGSAYAAFMVKVVTAQATGDYFFHFFDGAISGNLFAGRVFVKSATGGFVFGLNTRNVATQLVWDTTVYPLNSTHLVVVKYNYNSTTNLKDESCQLFIDPAIACTEPASILTSVSDGTLLDFVSLDGVAIRQGSAGSAGTMQVDGIRVADNWGDAVTSGCATPARTSTWGQLKGLYR